MLEIALLALKISTREDKIVQTQLIQKIIADYRTTKSRRMILWSKTNCLSKLRFSNVVCRLSVKIQFRFLKIQHFKETASLSREYRRVIPDINLSHILSFLISNLLWS